MPEKQRGEPSLLAAEPFADRSTRSGKHISLRADPVVIRGTVGRPGSISRSYIPMGIFSEVPALARQQNKWVKVVGGGHSPSDIACTDGFLIHMGKMNRVLQVDTEKKQVTVEAGIHLADLHPQLDKHGLALSNLGAMSDVTAGGIIGTGTHNTGIKHSILATQVVALTLLTADGTILECSESSNAEVFQAVQVRLGCLGVILTITLQCVPQFHLQKTSFPSTLREPPSSSASWFGDYAIGFHLLEFLLWIRYIYHNVHEGFLWLTYVAEYEALDPVILSVNPHEVF
ncbi:L-gulonolactone oxidase [Pteropus alecto]|uniref:L-gulonolactone oxidase n=1 Tax=Pteropus alecto TaxID=9402 RepID=UPI0007688F68|nr:L-gulonolactone oxidase [Pteropus alecto]